LASSNPGSPDPSGTPEAAGAAPMTPTRGILRLLGYARPYLHVIAIAVVFSLLYGGGLTGRAYLLAPIIDEVALPNASLSSLDDLREAGEVDPAEVQRERDALRARVQDNFTRVFIAGVGLIFFMPAVRLFRDYASDWLMSRLQVDMQADLGAKLLRLPLAHHVRESSGDFMARVGSDTHLANQAQKVVFGEVLHDGALIVVALGAAFWVNWQMALVLLCVGPPIAIVLRVFGGRIRRASRSRQRQVSEVTQRLVRMLGGIKVIKAFHAEELESDAFSRSLKRYFRRSMKLVRNRVLSRSLVELASQGSFVMVLMVGVWGVLQGVWGLTLGSLAAFITISAMLYRPARSITSFYNHIQAAVPAAERIFEIIDAEETPADDADAVEIARIERGVRYRGVRFSYGREAVLDGVDLEIGAGEVVALVGRTGSGKTTIADLMLRFWDPDAGSIEIDGVDLRKIRRSSLHDMIAVVTQEPFLFDDNILENIRYGRRDASFDDVVAAAKAAFAHDFIVDLPDGYETLVGEDGDRLSGGQRQRLTIARAILRDPQLLIFDEATSALDAKIEGMLQRAVANLMRGRTVLLIAHRLSTVKGATRIAVVENGRISAMGSHDELMEKGGLYRELVDLQLSSD